MPAFIKTDGGKPCQAHQWSPQLPQSRFSFNCPHPSSTSLPISFPTSCTYKPSPKSHSLSPSFHIHFISQHPYQQSPLANAGQDLCHYIPLSDLASYFVMMHFASLLNILTIGLCVSTSLAMESIRVVHNSEFAQESFEDIFGKNAITKLTDLSAANRNMITLPVRGPDGAPGFTLQAYHNGQAFDLISQETEEHGLLAILNQAQEEILVVNLPPPREGARWHRYTYDWEIGPRETHFICSLKKRPQADWFQQHKDKLSHGVVFDYPAPAYTRRQWPSRR